MKKAKGFDF